MQALRRQLFELRCWLDDRFPDKRHKRVAGIAAVLALLCAGWISLFTVSAVARSSAGGVKLTPEIRSAQDLTAKLRATPAYASLSILPHLDYPDKLRVTGAVGSAADFDALPRVLQQLAPSRVFVIDVTAPK